MNHEQLRITVLCIDGRGYKAYRDVAGQWSFPAFTRHINHVQGYLAEFRRYKLAAALNRLRTLRVS